MSGQDRSAAQRHRRLEFHDPSNPDCRFSADPGVASPDADWCSCPIPEQPAAQDHGPGCRRHKRDPHNPCEACWALEPDRSQSRWSRFRSWLHDWIGRDNEPMSIESWWELND